ncbi:MAG: flagellar basal body P-ring protein FlgI [Pseudomonadota bacterium]
MEKGYLKFCIILVALTALVYSANPLWAVRVKDIADIEGVRPNQLIGYGLVVGLNGSGDKKDTKFTVQSLVNMLERMGVAVNSKDVKVKNVAAVVVTASLPSFAKAGSRIDVLVSSLGDATSLQGGTLLLTPLEAADGEIYAVAQGPISVGGFAMEGAGGGVQKNHPTVGRIIEGALVEREVQSNFNEKDSLLITLHNPDFTTVSRLTQAVNNRLAEDVTDSLDARTVRVSVPPRFQGKIVELVASIENLEVTVDTVAKVVLDERTGTVVMGENVRISTIAVSHGNLSIEIKEKTKVSQPLPFSSGETTVTPETDITVKEDKAQLLLVPSSISIGEVVRALNAIGVSPRDLIAIFQAIKAAGALQAVLEII